MTTFQPEPPAWTTEDPTRGGTFASARRATREALGLDPTARIVATGHQAAIWHPGILAKDLAVSSFVARAASQGCSMAGIHFIADHDANDGGLVAYPSSGPSRSSWRMLPGTERMATRDRPAATPSSPPIDAFRIEGVTNGLEAIHAAVAAHADAENLAWQLGLATRTLAAPFAGDLPRHSMSRLLELPIGLELIDRMARDPEACIAAHDAALENERRGRTKASGRLPRPVASPLGRGGTEELPLWRTTPQGRRPVRRGEKIDPASCRPRALLATALARLGGCDLFVHGLGGGLYDPAMEGWIEGWLGAEVVAELAPATVATATLRLPIEPTSATAIPEAIPEATPEGLHRLLSDPDLERTDPPRRERLLASIQDATPRSRDRRAAFDALRREIEQARARGRDTIDRYRERLATDQDRRHRRVIAEDRTWGFPLHEPAALRTLAREVEASFEKWIDEPSG